MITTQPITTTTSSSLNYRAIGMSVLLCTAFSYVFLRNHEDTTGLTYLYLLMLVQLTPITISFSLGKINYISLILFNHFVVYSLAKYNAMVNIAKLGAIYSDALRSIKELTFCTVLIIIGYFGGRLILFYRFSASRTFHFLKLAKWQLFLCGGYTISSAMLLAYLPPVLHTINFVIANASLVLLLTSVAPGFEMMALIFKFVTIFSTLQHFLRTGSLGLIGGLGSILFMTAVVQKKTKNIAFVFLIALLLAFIQPVKNRYREVIKTSRDLSIIERGLVLVELLHWRYVEGGGDLVEVKNDGDDDGQFNNKGIEGDLLKGFDRAGDDSLERVLAWTPSIVPFWEGETYSILPYMFIPRFLWPEKPKHGIWNKFGRLYGFLSSDDYYTSVGVSYLGEAYMNFGFLGMYTCAMFFGLFVILIERLSYFFIPGSYYFTFVCFLIPLMVYAADLSSVINSIVLMTAVLMVFRLQFQRMAMSDDYS